MPGIHLPAARNTLATQMVASLRREDYTRLLLTRPISQKRTDPFDSAFDPEMAAIFYHKLGNFDEAAWLVFLSVHFGQHRVYKWKRVADVYSGLGSGLWTWERVSGNPLDFEHWLRSNWQEIGGAFGNHRRYESLNPAARGGTAQIVASYISWIGPTKSHSARFSALIREGGNDPRTIFSTFYSGMQVLHFGRLGKFDFLCLLGRIGLVPLRPGSAYLNGATGPLRGARLLFGGNVASDLRVRDLDSWLIDLDDALQIGMQAMEDSLCNWQKSPNIFVHFRG